MNVKRLKIDPLHILVIVLLIVSWQVIAMQSQPKGGGPGLVPSIQEVVRGISGFAAFSDASAEEPKWIRAVQVLAAHSFATVLRGLGGTALGILAGVGIGLAMYYVPLLYGIAYPVVQIVRMVPILTLVPLFLLWFGGHEVGVWVYVTLGVFIIVIISTLEAVRNIPRVYLHMASCMGANRTQLFRTVIVPAVVPALVGTIRVALGAAWAIVLAAEYLAVEQGLGYLLILSERFFKVDRMVFVAVLFVSLSIIVNTAFLRFARRTTHWLP